VFTASIIKTISEARCRRVSLKFQLVPTSSFFHLGDVMSSRMWLSMFRSLVAADELSIQNVGNYPQVYRSWWQWSAYLSLAARFSGLNPVEDDRFLRAIKTRNATSFWGEVKPSVPYRKVSRHVKVGCLRVLMRYFISKIQLPFLRQVSPDSLLAVSSGWRCVKRVHLSDCSTSMSVSQSVNHKKKISLCEFCVKLAQTWTKLFWRSLLCYEP
jgi:hypothetical protein